MSGRRRSTAVSVVIAWAVIARPRAGRAWPGELLAARPRPRPRRRSAGSTAAGSAGRRSCGDARTSSTRDRVAEHRVRVVRGVPARLDRDRGEGLRARCRTSRRTPRRRRRRAARATGAVASSPGSRPATSSKRPNGVGPVVPVRAERAALHLLEAERQHALGGAGLDGLARQAQRRRPGRAVVVDVDDRDAGQADAVERRSGRTSSRRRRSRRRPAGSRRRSMPASASAARMRASAMTS